MEREDRILEGALDTHAHAYPEFTLSVPPRTDNVEWARLAVAAKMRGFVMKSHFWPTTMAAQMLRVLEPELEVFGSITLGPLTGGLDPLAVAVAADVGAKVVWMPTWSARQDPPRSSAFFERMMSSVGGVVDRERVQGELSLSVLDGDGALRPEVRTIVEMCAQRDVTIASGHIPVQASLVLAQEAQRAGTRFVLTHPVGHVVGASIEEQIQVADMGGLIEHVYVPCMPMHLQVRPQAIAEAIEAVGPERSIMASDAIEPWNPPAPELLRMFIGAMIALGFSEDDVHLMTHDNPARALGLEPQRAAPPLEPAPAARGES